MIQINDGAIGDATLVIGAVVVVGLAFAFSSILCFSLLTFIRREILGLGVVALHARVGIVRFVPVVVVGVPALVVLDAAMEIITVIVRVIIVPFAAEIVTGDMLRVFEVKMGVLALVLLNLGSVHLGLFLFTEIGRGFRIDLLEPGLTGRLLGPRFSGTGLFHKSGDDNSDLVEEDERPAE